MILLCNIVIALAFVGKALLNVYFWVVIAAAALTWIRVDSYHPIVRVLVALTEPVFYRVRKYLPISYSFGLDLSPVVVLVGIQLFEMIVLKTCIEWATLLK